MCARTTLGLARSRSPTLYSTNSPENAWKQWNSVPPRSSFVFKAVLPYAQLPTGSKVKVSHHPAQSAISASIPSPSPLSVDGGAFTQRSSLTTMPKWWFVSTPATSMLTIMLQTGGVVRQHALRTRFDTYWSLTIRVENQSLTWWSTNDYVQRHRSDLFWFY